MPSIGHAIRSKLLNWKLVYWRKTGSDNNGRPAYDDPPVELDCRWDEENHNVITADGRTVRTRAVILLVDKVRVGDLVWKGTRADAEKLPNWPAVPTVSEGGLELVTVDATNNIKPPDIVYEAYA